MTFERMKILFFIYCSTCFFIPFVYTGKSKSNNQLQPTNSGSRVLDPPKQCVQMVHLDFETCSKTGLIESKRNSGGKGGSIPCSKSPLCKLVYKISYIKLMPYLNMSKQVNEMLTGCCGSCSTLKRTKFFDSPLQVKIHAMKDVDFVFPFLAPTSQDELFGFYFIPIISLTNAYLFTPEQTNGTHIFLSLVSEVSKLWPFVITCLMLALLSGCIAWLLDTWTNEEEFPRAFYIGGFEGFWWAFISMTTVGYGDKSPRSWPARLFAVVWILFGITICSMFTAALTTTITSVINPGTPTIDGKTIGAFKYRLFEAQLIAQNGGILKNVDDNDIGFGIKKLIELTNNKTIEGFLLDTYLLNLFKRRAKFDQEKRKVVNELNEFSPNLVTDNKASLSMGLLVRNQTDYDYFKRYFSDNRINIEACLAYSVNSKYSPPEGSNNFLFSSENGVFLPMVYACVGILVAIAIISFMFEMLSKRIKTGSARIGSITEGKEVRERDIPT